MYFSDNNVREIHLDRELYNYFVRSMHVCRGPRTLRSARGWKPDGRRYFDQLQIWSFNSDENHATIPR
ncbi:hypothetical protein M407DRAFT_240541 [Tulasnella calospora MUT 4182]|uniref:Uncharacterized protein n=1 Tax=Tulasnella calospora MUT 4182 TaxID=1051891 RepID=A0A0C3QZ82_9AGAM|nr:hypothetical protein M407DRAFT_240541 [Tulasnella calospora MUT 4182]